MNNVYVVVFCEITGRHDGVLLGRSSETPTENLAIVLLQWGEQILVSHRPCPRLDRIYGVR